MKTKAEMKEWVENLPQKERAKMMMLVKRSREQNPQENNILNMNKLIIKIVLAIAIGVLVGTVSGNLESNKTVTYFKSGSKSPEISKSRYYRIFKKLDNNYGPDDVYKKVVFNKEIGFYYGAVTGASLIILFLIHGLIKKQVD